MTKRTDHRLSIAGGVLFGALFLAGMSPAPLSGQDMDARWLPWLGCWEAVEAGEETPLLCVRPAAEGAGVEFISWSQGELSPPEAILADGVPRNVEREECQGVEEARFSEDGHRIYLNSRYVCEEGGEQKATGILAMLNPMEWADIKSVNGTPWVLKYRLARSSSLEAAPLENAATSRAGEVKVARIRASERLTEEDVIEAAAYVDGPAVEALIVERGDPFEMSADLLVQLDEAGLPDNVIDLMVAVSYPERFAVKAGPTPVEEYVDDEGRARRPMFMGGAFWGSRYGRFGYNPFFFDPFYSGFGYGYGSYYGGYGGYGYGYGGYGYPYQPRPIIVTPVGGSSGRAVKGRGYTRGGAGSGYSGRTARPRSGSSSAGRSSASPGVRSSGGRSSAGRSAKPRGGGGSVSSSSTRSSSSSSGAARRTAKPRGGGLY